jgi:hypothetical protein
MRSRMRRSQRPPTARFLERAAPFVHRAHTQAQALRPAEVGALVARRTTPPPPHVIAPANQLAAKAPRATQTRSNTASFPPPSSSQAHRAREPVHRARARRNVNRADTTWVPLHRPRRICAPNPQALLAPFEPPSATPLLRNARAAGTSLPLRALHSRDVALSRRCALATFLRSRPLRCCDPP